MTLRHLRIFTEVYRQSSVTKAADALHLSQPSVSLALKELETHYGVRLFERFGRHISPTGDGQEFYGYALHIVSLFDDMEKQMRRGSAGSLRVGTSITVGTHILPALLQRCKADFPTLQTTAVIANSGDIEQHVADNTVDLGLIEAQPARADICAEPFMEDSLCAVVPPHHPLAVQETVALAQLAAEPFLLREKGSGARELLEAALAMQGLSVQPRLESTSTQAILQGVAAGFGVAVLPCLLVERDRKEGLVRAVPLDKPLRRNLNIIYHKSKYLSPAMRAFIALCKDYGKVRQTEDILAK